MRYFVAFVVALGLVLMLAFLLFHGGGSPKKLTIKTLESYAATNSEVQMTIDGPINANQQHQQVKITAGSSNVTYEQLKGYNGDVVNLQNFANTEAAYYNFLAALGHAGFTKGDNNPLLKNESGYCPLGNRYVFVLRQDGQDVQRYWTTSCDKTKTYLGAQSLTITLFQRQVPGYDVLTQSLNL